MYISDSLNTHRVALSPNPTGTVPSLADCPPPCLVSYPGKEVIVRTLASQMIKEHHYLRHWKNLNLLPKFCSYSVIFRDFAQRNSVVWIHVVSGD